MSGDQYLENLSLECDSLLYSGDDEFKEGDFLNCLCDKICITEISCDSYEYRQHNDDDGEFVRQ